jgi:flotillin
MAQEEARLVAERRRQVEALEHKEALQRRTQEAELERLRDRAAGERERAQIELSTKREAGELEAELARIERSAHADLSEARLQEIMLTETMPAIAEAFRGSFDRVNVTSGDGSNLFAFLSAGLDQVMEVAQKRRTALPQKASK